MDTEDVNPVEGSLHAGLVTRSWLRKVTLGLGHLPSRLTAILICMEASRV